MDICYIITRYIILPLLYIFEYFDFFKSEEKIVFYDEVELGTEIKIKSH